MIDKLWRSATFMTWGNMLIRTLGLLVLTPMVLTNLSNEEVVVWYLFSSLMALQLMLDMGFQQTFSRLISYGMGGLSAGDLLAIGNKREEKNLLKEPDWGTITCIDKVMLRTYRIISLFALCIGGLFGSWALNGPISNTANSTLAWWGWVAVLLSSCWMLFGNNYAAYLQGINEIARVQRWQMITALLATLMAALVLSMGGELFWTIVSYQTILGINVAINSYLKKQLGAKTSRKDLSAEDLQAVWLIAWPTALRSGAGVLMSAGLIQLSGMVYAQLGRTSSVASYLLGLQLIRMISSFSQAPFYTQLPVLARLYASNSMYEIISLAKSGMRKAYFVFTTGFFLVGWQADNLLSFIRSNVEFPGVLMWSLLGFGMFFERYGAMHIQLYSITNHIIWHIANGITGVIMLVLSMVLYPLIGVYAFPMAFIAGYFGFYAWYCSGYSYRALDLDFVAFEKTAMLPWLTVLIGAICLLGYANT